MPLARNPGAPAWRPLTVVELANLGTVVDLALEAAKNAHRDTAQSAATGVWLILVHSAHEAAQLIIQDDMLRRPEAWHAHVAAVEEEQRETLERHAELEADGQTVPCNQDSRTRFDDLEVMGCTMCTGEACALCGAGLWRQPYLDGVMCEHDVVDRHTRRPER